MFGDSVRIFIGAVLAVLLQVLISPNIAIFHAMPNLLVVYTLIVAMVAPGSSHVVLAFCMGMISDLLGYGPVGAMPLLLMLACVAASRIHGAFANGTLFIPLVVLAVAILLIEFLYAFIAVGVAGTSPLDAFVYRALPCTLYNCVIGLVLYPLAARFFSNSQPQYGSVVPGPHLD